MDIYEHISSVLGTSLVTQMLLLYNSGILILMAFLLFKFKYQLFVSDIPSKINWIK